MNADLLFLGCALLGLTVLELSHVKPQKDFDVKAALSSWLRRHLGMKDLQSTKALK